MPRQMYLQREVARRSTPDSYAAGFFSEPSPAAPSMHINLGFAVAVICTLSGVSILYIGITTSDISQVLGGATLLSVAW